MVDYMVNHGHDAQEIEEYLVDASEEYSTQINENFTGIYGWIEDTYIDGVGWIPGPDYVPTERVWYTDAMDKGGEAALVSPYIDAQTNQVISEKLEHDWYVVMIINSADLFAKVERVLFINIILSLLVFGMVAYFCTASHYHKMKSMHYAEELKEYQRTLEDRVLEQTKEIRKQSEEMIRMQEDVIEGMATLIESRDENTGEHVKNTKWYVAMIVKKCKRRKCMKILWEAVM